MKAITTKEFILESRKVHGNRYDYSKVEYINSSTRVLIICRIHGEFLQFPYYHKKGCNCPKCSNCKKLTTEEFIERARKIHGPKYDYSESVYKSAHTKIKIICKIHGKFFQTASSHINTKCICPKCADINRSIGHSRDTNEYIKKAKKKHGNKFDYSKVKYKSAHKKIWIICKLHGKFFQSPNNHLRGDGGCLKCRKILLQKKFSSNAKEFIKKANLIHDNYYDYSLVIYKAAIRKVKIICSMHGIFLQSPNSHLRGCGCPRHHLSKGELKIIKWLNKKKIKFISQKSFKDLKGLKDRKLLFDIFIPYLNYLIEYDGQQHFFCSNGVYSKEDVEKIKMYDLKKNDYCIKNKIPLYRIPYTKFNVIEKVLEEIFFNNSKKYLIKGL